MQGSLDQPPIVIGMDQKSAGLGLGASLLAMLALWYFGYQHTGTFFFACIAAAACALLFLTSPVMRVSPEGLAWGNRLGSKSWTWDEFDSFDVRTIPIFGLSVVGCNFSPVHAGGHEGIIGLLWEIPARDLVPLLNKAREYWTAPGK